MSAETALRAALLADSAVASIVGQRVALDRMEEGAATPFVVFARSGTGLEYAIDGALLGSQVTLELQCWADTFLQSSALADAVQAVLLTALPHQVRDRANSYDPDLGLSMTALSITWWEIAP